MDTYLVTFEKYNHSPENVAQQKSQMDRDLRRLAIPRSPTFIVSLTYITAY